MLILDYYSQLNDIKNEGLKWNNCVVGINYSFLMLFKKAKKVQLIILIGGSNCLVISVGPEKEASR